MERPLRNKTMISLPELMFKIPGVAKDLPKILTALYYNFTIRPETHISISDVFNKTVQRYPDRNCLYHQDDVWTYKSFNHWVNRLANQFSQMGFKHGDVVAVLLENRPEILAISMAMAKIGCVAALINTSQRNKPLLHSFRLAKPKLILIGVELIAHFNEIEQALSFPQEAIQLIKHKDISLTNAKWSFFDMDCPSHDVDEPKPTKKIKSKDAHLYIYTSGTTGLPKASVISHGRWIKAYAAFGLTSLRLTPEDILYVPLPFFHATAMLVCWCSVVAGGSAIIMKKKFSVTEFWGDIHKYKATGFGYVGEMCKYLINAPIHPLEHANTLTKMIGNGLRPEIWNDFKKRFGIAQIAEFYASSEGNIAFFNVFNMDATMGFTVTSYAIVAYDQENDCPVLNKRGFMQKVPVNGVGLLLGEINDRYPFDGYTEKHKTEKAILRNVFRKGDAWFNTGDLVRDMGFAHTQFVDRLGDTFRWKSENVSTTEVEGIINQFSGIMESIVYGVQIPHYPGRAGMANLILEEHTIKIDLQAFYDFIKDELPTYAIPIFLRISHQTETTSTFKYKKSALKDDGYDCDKIGKEVYVLLDRKYQKVTTKLRDGINEGKYKF